MTKFDRPRVRTLLGDLMVPRAGSGQEQVGTTAAARRIYDELATVFVPLVSQGGFDALLTRAFQLTQRQYPGVGPSAGDGEDADPFARVGRWLDENDQPMDAAAALFAALNELLTTLIGESLTTRYVRKAWPDSSSATRSKGKRV